MFYFIITDIQFAREAKTIDTTVRLKTDISKSFAVSPSIANIMINLYFHNFAIKI